MLTKHMLDIGTPQVSSTTAILKIILKVQAAERIGRFATLPAYFSATVMSHAAQ
jgi:hypothetical protein